MECSLLHLAETSLQTKQALTGGKGVSYEADLWAFGCIIYQMLEGKPPFKAGSEYLTFEKILALDYCLPDHFPEAAKDIVRSLLMIDHTTRLGKALNLQYKPYVDGRLRIDLMVPLFAAQCSIFNPATSISNKHCLPARC